MRFLVDEDLPRSTNDVLRRYKHEAIDVRGIGLRGAKDHQIAAYAQSEGLCLLTGDFDFSDIRNYPPGEYSGFVVLKLPGRQPLPSSSIYWRAFCGRKISLVRCLVNWQLWNLVELGSDQVEGRPYFT